MLIKIWTHVFGRANMGRAESEFCVRGPSQSAIVFQRICWCVDPVLILVDPPAFYILVTSLKLCTTKYFQTHSSEIRLAKEPRICIQIRHHQQQQQQRQQQLYYPRHHYNLKRFNKNVSVSYCQFSYLCLLSLIAPCCFSFKSSFKFVISDSYSRWPPWMVWSLCTLWNYLKVFKNLHKVVRDLYRLWQVASWRK